MARIDGRTYKDLRPVEIIPGVNKFAEGSCLIRCGNTMCCVRPAWRSGSRPTSPTARAG